MPNRWEYIWGQYQQEKLTVTEIVQAVISGLEIEDLAAVLDALPTEYREVLRQFVESGRVPWGVYCFDQTTTLEESRRLHQEILAYNERAVEAISVYFRENAGRRENPPS
jgi:hypothetical protein